MRITREESADNRARILAAAARLFREKGFDGAGVADLMREAGLTHGGFYNHFPSKEALAAAACDQAFETSIATLTHRLEGTSGRARTDALAEHVANYLSSKARDAAAARCPMVALTADAVRQGPEVRQRFAAGTRRYIEALGSSFAPPERPGKRATARVRKRAREDAIAALAMMVGGLLLARGARDGDLALSDEILATLRTAIGSRLLTPSRKRAPAP
jgi:TetR/AcrR family transcriptional regulator, transcriptional repressor for nem operon